MLKRLLRYVRLMPILLYHRWRKPDNFVIMLAVERLHSETFDPNREERRAAEYRRKLVEKTDPEAIAAWKKIYD